MNFLSYSPDADADFTWIRRTPSNASRSVWYANLNSSKSRHCGSAWNMTPKQYRSSGAVREPQVFAIRDAAK